MSNLKIRSINEHDLELLQLPLVDTLFPISFSHGVTYQVFSMQCPQCKKKIDNQNCFAKLVAHSNEMIQLIGCGTCLDCKLLNSFDYRLYSDGRIVGLKNGKWTTQQMVAKKASFLQKILSFFY